MYGLPPAAFTAGVDWFFDETGPRKHSSLAGRRRVLKAEAEVSTAGGEGREGLATSCGGESMALTERERRGVDPLSWRSLDHPPVLAG